MTAPIGHLIRITGLLIEMLGVWAVYAGRDDKNPTLVSFPGGKAVPVAWLAVGLGFVLWLIGTIVISVARSRRRAPRAEEKIPDSEVN
jgi:hypothetical protein